MERVTGKDHSSVPWSCTKIVPSPAPRWAARLEHRFDEEQAALGRHRPTAILDDAPRRSVVPVVQDALAQIRVTTEFESLNEAGHVSLLQRVRPSSEHSSGA